MGEESDVTPCGNDDVIYVTGGRGARADEVEQEAREGLDPDEVREHEDVAAKARKQGETVHFGHLMALCHEKHSELQRAVREFKGRVVFRGDDVKDESGYYAVFSEQGTSASHLSAAKFLDAMARFDGNYGSDSDATGAYTQVLLEDLEK